MKDSLPNPTGTTLVEPNGTSVNEPAHSVDAQQHTINLNQQEEADKRRKKYLAQLEAQHQAEVRRIEYEKQVRQQQIRAEMEQRRKRYEQQGFRY